MSTDHTDATAQEVHALALLLLRQNEHTDRPLAVAPTITRQVASWPRSQVISLVVQLMILNPRRGLTIASQMAGGLSWIEEHPPKPRGRKVP